MNESPMTCERRLGHAWHFRLLKFSILFDAYYGRNVSRRSELIIDGWMLRSAVNVCVCVWLQLAIEIADLGNRKSVSVSLSNSMIMHRDS